MRIVFIYTPVIYPWTITKSYDDLRTVTWFHLHLWTRHQH